MLKRGMSSPMIVFPILISHYRVISFRETTTLKTMTVLTNPKFETMRSNILSSSMVAYASVLSVKIKCRYMAYLSRDMLFPTMWHYDKCRLRRVCAASF